MHIKSLKIQGFKSYRDETVVDPFSPGLNLLVGRNGSGKSNFFSAIRFVLSDQYTSLAREERQSLLHDGTTGGAGGGATMSAYVEIEFDNTDGRFPTGKPSLLLRRTIGLKKDEYQLDRKSTSKSEVMSILESAGFSRSNPYYIVPQGRITHLTNQKDSDRLALLKEVAGTKVYEERRAESTKIMDETNIKREKVDDLLESINSRLGELEEEKKELKEFQDQDKIRRTMEYHIYQRDLNDIGENLDHIEEERRRDVDNANTRREEANDRQKEMDDLEADLVAQKQRVEMLKIEHRETSGERREAIKAQAEVECIVTDAEEAGKKGKNRLTKLEAELTAIEEEITSKEAELLEAAPAYEDKAKALSDARQVVENANTQLGTLRAKQGRKHQFKTQKERDAHLRTMIASHATLLSERHAGAQAAESALSLAKTELEEGVRRHAEMRKDLEDRKHAQAELQTQLSKLREEQRAKTEQRKDLWKEGSKLEQQYRHADEQLKAAERTISSTMDRDTAAGLRSAKAIATRLNLDGYHGPLYELFSCEDRYKTAVEVTAGTSLFQIVVDNDETATKILEVMNREKSGRITFMPLNRIKSKEVDYPNSREALPMIKKLDFDRAYTKAMEQVFGRTIICQTLEIAGAYTRSHNLNSITLDGDKYDRKGSLTGGYHDQKRSRLDAVRNFKSWQSKVEELSQQRDEVVHATARIDQEVTQLVGQIQVAEGKLSRLGDERAPLIAAVMDAQTESDRTRTRIARLENNLETLKQDERGLESEKAAYEAELKTKMAQSLTDEELQLVEDLTAEIEVGQKTVMELAKEATRLESDKEMLEIELEEKLRRRRDELRGKIEAINAGGPQQSQATDVVTRKAELKRLHKRVEDLTAKLDEIETETEEVSAQIAALQKEREKKLALQSDDQRSIAKQQKNVERYLHKRQVLMQRKEECQKSIRDLGVLPEEAFRENNDSTEQLAKKLRRAREALSKFAHVNKKAFEQYTSFTKQRDELMARQEELDESSTSILELIEVLDARKDEAIERTFKQVAKYFEEVFEKLVPAGRGRLIMQRREMQKDVDDMDVDAEEEEQDGGVENYTGVAIRVSFNSKSNEGLKIQQLSGGQKALVALAMIFAIQKCDPAPFYLFDEIDANLDADRRTGVAAMISELSESGQYICTTFRPELIPHAESYFGVIFNATKISNVKQLTADECQEFIEAAEQVRAA